MKKWLDKYMAQTGKVVSDNTTVKKPIVPNIIGLTKDPDVIKYNKIKNDEQWGDPYKFLMNWYTDPETKKRIKEQGAPTKPMTSALNQKRYNNYYDWYRDSRDKNIKEAKAIWKDDYFEATKLGDLLNQGLEAKYEDLRENTLGVHFPNQSVVALNNDLFGVNKEIMNSTAVHELTHATPLDDFYVDYFKKNKPKNPSGTEEKYFSENPDEIYPRIQELRYQMWRDKKIAPGTKITPSLLEGYDNDNSMDLKKYFSPKELSKIMNEIAYEPSTKKPIAQAQNGIEGTMGGLTDQGFNYNGAWGGTMAMGGSLPGSVGFTYARTQDPAPSKGKYAKKTMASAQDRKKISYNQWKKENNLKETSDYNLKRAWELGYTPDKTGHLPTVDNQTGKFLKAKGHPTLNLELDWYNSPEGAEFKSKHTLDSTGKFFKYVPKLQNGQEMKFYQEGLDWKPKSISQWGGDYALDADQAIQTIVNVSDVMSAPQQGAIKALTGKYQMPSEALGIKNPLGQFAIDMFTDPSIYLGAGVFKKGIGAASKMASKVGKGTSKFKKDFMQGYRPVPVKEDGGVIEDDMGQWAHPGEITKINSNKITMQGVGYPVLGISDTGDTQMMQPGQDYIYEGESVTEIPMAQDGYSEPDYATGTIRRGYNKAAQISNYLVPAETLNAAADIAKRKGLDFGIETRGPADAVRHAAAAASVSSKVPVPKLISDYSPNLDKAIRIAAANLLGFGHELKNMNEGFLMDIKNNYQGSLIGSIPGLTDKERNKMVVNQLINKQLTVDNPKKKKENGGWLSKYN